MLNRLIKKTVEDKKYDQKYKDRKATLMGMRRFLIDSFAIAVIVKSHLNVSDYLIWFKEWTEDLLKQWPENQRKIDGKDVQIRYGKTDHNIDKTG